MKFNFEYTLTIPETILNIILYIVFLEGFYGREAIDCNVFIFFPITILQVEKSCNMYILIHIYNFLIYIFDFKFF